MTHVWKRAEEGSVSQQARVIATPPVCSCDSLRSEVMKTAMAPWITDSRVESQCMSVANVSHVYMVLYKWRVIHCQFLKRKVFSFMLI